MKLNDLRAAPAISQTPPKIDGFAHSIIDDHAESRDRYVENKVRNFEQRCGKIHRHVADLDINLAMDHCIRQNGSYLHTIYTYNSLCGRVASSVILVSYASPAFHEVGPRSVKLSFLYSMGETLDDRDTTLLSLHHNVYIVYGTNTITLKAKLHAIQAASIRN